MSSEPSWNAGAVERGIAGTRFAGMVQHFLSVGSTSTVALEAAQSGSPEGHVWVADEQTAGRGRGGHTWHSEARAGLYFSLLLRPRMAAAEALWLSLATGLAIQAAVLEVTGLRSDIRWPNDLLLGGKKFGGVLVETSATPAETSLRHAVIGIGLNVGHGSFPQALSATATSLLLESGRFWPREALLAAILRALDREIDSLDAAPETLLDRFAAASTWVLGKRVRVGDGDGYTGVTSGLDPRGFLQVLAADGTLRTVLSGGVRPL